MVSTLANAVTWDVGVLTKDYLDNNWGTLSASSNPTKPSTFRLFSEDEDGNPKKGWDPAGQEYVLVKEVDETRGIEPVDGPRDVFNLSATTQVRITTPTSRARRTAMFDEIMVLWENVRKRSSQDLGSWDTITLEPVNVPDEMFNFWMSEWTWLFEKKGVVLE